MFILNRLLIVSMLADLATSRPIDSPEEKRNLKFEQFFKHLSQGHFGPENGASEESRMYADILMNFAKSYSYCKSKQPFPYSRHLSRSQMYDGTHGTSQKFHDKVEKESFRKVELQCISITTKPTAIVNQTSSDNMSVDQNLHIKAPVSIKITVPWKTIIFVMLGFLLAGMVFILYKRYGAKHAILERPIEAGQQYVLLHYPDVGVTLMRLVDEE